MLDFRRLVVLHAVARHGSMSKAAVALAFTPSAVSQQIAALERQVGTSLVARHARGVRLTEGGGLLVEHTEALLQRLAQAETELDDLVHLRAGRLRLATFPSAGFRLVPDAVLAFRDAHPDIRMSLDIREPTACAPLIRAGALDMAVVFEYLPGAALDVDGLDRQWLLDDLLYVAVPAEQAKTLPDHVSIAELRGHHWIRDSGPDPMCREKLDELCAEAGYRPQISFETDDYLTVSRLVAGGMGLALVPQLAAEKMGPGVELRPIRPRVVRRISIITATNPSPAVEAMLAILAGPTRRRWGTVAGN